MEVEAERNEEVWIDPMLEFHDSLDFLQRCGFDLDFSRELLVALDWDVDEVFNFCLEVKCYGLGGQDVTPVELVEMLKEPTFSSLANVEPKERPNTEDWDWLIQTNLHPLNAYEILLEMGDEFDAPWHIHILMKDNWNPSDHSVEENVARLRFWDERERQRRKAARRNRSVSERAQRSELSEDSD